MLPKWPVRVLHCGVPPNVRLWENQLEQVDLQQLEPAKEKGGLTRSVHICTRTSIKIYDIYIYVCMYVCMYVDIYIYVYFGDQSQIRASWGVVALELADYSLPLEQSWR